MKYKLKNKHTAFCPPVPERSRRIGGQFRSVAKKQGVFILLAITLLTGFLFTSCEDDKEIVTPPTIEEPQAERIIPPTFNADSAYHFVKAQVDFGPRVPNSKAHAACAEYLVNELKRFGAEVIVQEATARAFDGTILNMKNIIGQFSPEKEKRLLLCAHWDTRPFADKDTKDQNKPIDGANDGASGVGVLLEIARAMQEKQPEYGIDIIFFDAEDYGATDAASANYRDYKEAEKTWCLGSQHWAKNPHVAGYRAKYGILLDMVGAKNAVFLKEEYSRMYALKVVNNVWNRAHALGYENYFEKRIAGGITDDHKFINEYAGIPCINIIDFDGNRSGFGHFHHTHKDNMDIIDKNTLKAVGDVVLDVIFNER
jgi:Zn-dependent M28 family amino/carboxypeptidase